jgi:hypothetical protein
MRTRAESLFLGAAWIAIAGAALAGAGRLSRIPEIDPRVPALERKFREQAAGPRRPVPADRSEERFRDSRRWTAEARSSPRMDWAASFYSELVPVELPPGVTDQGVLPAVQETTSAADLDGVTLAWKTGKAEAKLGEYRRRVEAAPSGFRIYRREAGAEWELRAVLGAKSATWRDADAPADRVLEYRVELEGAEDAIRPLEAGETSVRTPKDRRVEVLLLATDLATVRVEAYNRQERKWEGRVRHYGSGDELWPGGWRLIGLKFRGAALEAEFERPGGGVTSMRSGQKD